VGPFLKSNLDVLCTDVTISFIVSPRPKGILHNGRLSGIPSSYTGKRSLERRRGRTRGRRRSLGFCFRGPLEKAVYVYDHAHVNVHEIMSSDEALDQMFQPQCRPGFVDGDHRNQLQAPPPSRIYTPQLCQESESGTRSRAAQSIRLPAEQKDTCAARKP